MAIASLILVVWNRITMKPYCLFYTGFLSVWLLNVSEKVISSINPVFCNLKHSMCHFFVHICYSSYAGTLNHIIKTNIWIKRWFITSTACFLKILSLKWICLIKLYCLKNKWSKFKCMCLFITDCSQAETCRQELNLTTSTMITPQTHCTGSHSKVLSCKLNKQYIYLWVTCA